MSSNQDKPVWERQPGETPKAYQAFVVYRDLGRDRSQYKAAKKLGKSAVLLHRWSVKYGWVKRVDIYDEYLNTKTRLENEELIKQAKIREVAAGTALMEKLLARVNSMHPDEITPNLISQMAKTASELARLGLDVYTQASRTEITGPDGQVLPSLPAFKVVFEEPGEKNE